MHVYPYCREIFRGRWRNGNRGERSFEEKEGYIKRKEIGCTNGQGVARQVELRRDAKSSFLFIYLFSFSFHCPPLSLSFSLYHFVFLNTCIYTYIPHSRVPILELARCKAHGFSWVWISHTIYAMSRFKHQTWPDAKSKFHCNDTFNK